MYNPVGLGDGLNRVGVNAIICLREPSLGPGYGEGRAVWDMLRLFQWKILTCISHISRY